MIDWRVAVWIGASSAADFPAIAVVAVSAVTCETPHIMQGENCGFGLGEGSDREIAKVTTVEIVKVEQIGCLIEWVLGNFRGGDEVNVI